MANIYDIGEVNGVTKMSIVNGFIYHFPLAIITTDTDNDSMVIAMRGQSSATYLRLNQISEQLGQNSIEQYVDKIAELGYYKQAQIVADTRGTGEMQNDFQTETMAVLSCMNATLEKILFTLKGISE